MTAETKEQVVSILIGIAGIAVGGWLCKLSVNLIGTCDADDYTGLIAGATVGAMGVVLVMSCVGLVAWMVDGLIGKGSCDADV